LVYIYLLETPLQGCILFNVLGTRRKVVKHQYGVVHPSPINIGEQISSIRRSAGSTRANNSVNFINKEILRLRDQ